MARIRLVEIRHFRGIKELKWYPAAGANCLIGPGDSSKSTILDAIDLCIGARRQVVFSDNDFHCLDVEKPIVISITIGELDESLKSLDAYGVYLRGFNAESRSLEDEPEKDAETVLTVQLSVGSDLEPVWTLISERADAQGLSRNLAWADRVRLSPARIGISAEFNLGWRKGSVLNRLSGEQIDAIKPLAEAGRKARSSFGDDVNKQLVETLKAVLETAKSLGVPVGAAVKAMLEPNAVSLGGGSISLHNEQGVPLRGLGVGSSRLLIAGLQRRAAEQATIQIMDEVEYGLEPHRIHRLLHELGAKDKTEPLQVFMATHSPVVLRELSISQLAVVRAGEAQHSCEVVAAEEGMQGTMRLYPEAFLSQTVLVCEGASEVGLVRGVDQFRANTGHQSMNAVGIGLVDAKGITNVYSRASVFQKLGYRAAVIRDDDVKPDAKTETEFVGAGGQVTSWRFGRSLEEELFASLSDVGANKLINRAIDLHGEKLVDDHVRSAADGKQCLTDCRALSKEARATLGKAAKAKASGWFKDVSSMEDVARDIVGPDLEMCDVGFRKLVDGLFGWITNG